MTLLFNAHLYFVVFFSMTYISYISVIAFISSSNLGVCVCVSVCLCFFFSQNCTDAFIEKTKLTLSFRLKISCFSSWINLYYCIRVTHKMKTVVKLLTVNHVSLACSVADRKSQFTGLFLAEMHTVKTQTKRQRVEKSRWHHCYMNSWLARLLMMKLTVIKSTITNYFMVISWSS